MVLSKTGHSNCCKCVWWIIGVAALLIVIIGVASAILYLVFQPKLPKYSVDSVRVTDLKLNVDMSLYARFQVNITADNPNKKIGIYYERGGRLSVWYTETKLCEGEIPNFYQSHQNKTKLSVVLTGRNQYGNAIISALQQQQQRSSIPLELKVDAPIALKPGKLKLRKVRVLGHCKLRVDALSPNTLLTIKTTNCAFRLRL